MTPHEYSEDQLLEQPAPDLSAEERTEVKKVAKELLGKLKGGLIVLNWRAKASARSRIRMISE